MSKSQAAHLFGVGLSTVKRYVKMWPQQGSLALKKRPGKNAKIDEIAKCLLEDLKARPEVTLRQRGEFLEVTAGVRVSQSTICRTIKRLQCSRDEFLRSAWQVLVIAILDARLLVFVDECVTHIPMAPLYGDMLLKASGHSFP